jgi:hypothetical protein
MKPKKMNLRDQLLLLSLFSRKKAMKDVFKRWKHQKLSLEKLLRIKAENH